MRSEVARNLETTGKTTRIRGKGYPAICCRRIKSWRLLMGVLVQHLKLEIQMRHGVPMPDGADDPARRISGQVAAGAASAPMDFAI